MSANEWRTCPRCFKVREEETYELKAELIDSYGKIPPDKFMKRAGELKKPIHHDVTLAEYYEIWVDAKGKFIITYGCKCDKCGFEYVFNYEKQLEIS